VRLASGPGSVSPGNGQYWPRLQKCRTCERDVPSPVPRTFRREYGATESVVY
jgi:hypothetical protein